MCEFYIMYACTCTHVCTHKHTQDDMYNNPATTHFAKNASV